MNSAFYTPAPRMPTGRNLRSCDQLVLELPQMLMWTRSAGPWPPLLPLPVQVPAVCALLTCKMHFGIPLVI